MNARPEGQPFFLWLAALDPHRPYDEGILDRPHTVSEVRVPPTLPDLPEVRQDLALYYDEITRLDRYVGKILDAVHQQGISRNTLILFISDNGRPFPRDKTTLYDSGIRTPMLAVWEGHVAPGSSCPYLVSSVDLAPGFLQLAGLDIPSSMAGTSFAPCSCIPSNPYALLLLPKSIGTITKITHGLFDPLTSNTFSMIITIFP